jgi:hypothetical protein
MSGDQDRIRCRLGWLLNLQSRKKFRLSRHIDDPLGFPAEDLALEPGKLFGQSLQFTPNPCVVGLELLVLSNQVVDHVRHA